MKTLLTFVALALSFAPVSFAAASASRPNILFILADDLGLDGVGCYGSDTHKTPSIDKLAASGTRFEICYAAPLCGPSRCLLNTGRYAFRTGGITNQSWRGGGPGAVSANEQPIAKMMKQAGYATGMAGKWRQVGETPREWGFDEYTTDPTASGWYWQTNHQTNGKDVTAPDGTYAPEYCYRFTVDFLQRHKDEPFYFYFSQHLVHTPTLHTPDSPEGAADGPERYEDNIAYMDKQVGQLVAELERLGLREKTLVIFTGDNGTAVYYPSPVHGRMLSGHKGTMQEGGSRVPFIASWPGVTPAGNVNKTDILSFADCHATFCELVGVKQPAGLRFDGYSFAGPLRGQPAATPRPWAYVQLGANWFVREPRWKMNQSGELFDMSDAPFVETPVTAKDDTAASKAARQRLAAVLRDLNPASGKTDTNDGAAKKQKRKAKRK